MIGTAFSGAILGVLTVIGTLIDPNLAAYGGLLVALAAAYQSTRITGPNRQKIIAEAGSLADRRILEWSDRISKENEVLRARERWLEARVDQLEACIRNAGIAVPISPPAPQ